MSKCIKDNKIIIELQDLRRLNWSRLRRSSGTAGSFLKASENRSGRKIYYKLSDYDPFKGIVGHECVNEIIVDRLLDILRVPHLSYKLIHALVQIDGREHRTWLCASEDFKRPGESKIALDVYYQMERQEGESPLAFCLRMGWGDYIYQMLAVDYLILNRDRHGANLEVLRSREDKTIRLAPLFDHGLSFYCTMRGEQDLIKEDPLQDKRVQSFIGGNSAKDNLELIPDAWGGFPETFREDDRERLFDGLEEVCSHALREAVWKMLWERWSHYESIRHS